MHVIVRVGGGRLLLGVGGVFTNRVAMEISAGQLFLWFDRSAWVAVINYAKNIDYRAQIVPVNRKFTSPRHLRDSSQLAWSAKQGFLYPWRQVFYYVTPKQWNYIEKEKEHMKREKIWRSFFFLDHSVSFTLFLLILCRSAYLSIYFRLFLYSLSRLLGYWVRCIFVSNICCLCSISKKMYSKCWNLPETSPPQLGNFRNSHTK